MAFSEVFFGVRNVIFGPQDEDGSLTSPLIIVDATTQETHEKKADVTQHPVEKQDGGLSNVSDHNRKRPDGLMITGIISDKPLIFLGSVVLAGQQPSIDAWQTMQSYMEQSRLISIFTNLQFYKNMQIENLKSNRGTGKGGALFFQMRLMEVRHATLRTAAVASTTNVQGATKSRGNVAQKQANAAISTQGSNSVLRMLTSGLTGVAQ